MASFLSPLGGGLPTISGHYPPGGAGTSGQIPESSSSSPFISALGGGLPSVSEQSPAPQDSVSMSPGAALAASLDSGIGVGGDLVTLRGTEGNDVWKMGKNEDGSYSVSLNGKITNYSAEEAAKLVFDLGKGNNSFTADGAVDLGLRIKGGDGNNTVVGGGGADTIALGNGNNRIYGGEGNDTIAVGHGNNNINGGDGSDFISAGNGNNVIDAGKITDKAEPVRSGIGGVLGSILTGSIAYGGDSINVGDGNNKITGSNKSDAITAGNGNNKIDSGDGADNVTVGDGNNKIDLGKGDDRATAGNGDNSINGGAGNDYVIAGDGRNVVNGGAGNDNIKVGNGDDVVNGGSGDDVIRSTGGKNELSGGFGNDYIEGGKGSDVISGGMGDDVIYGLDGDDVISGGTGNDYIDGGNGNDSISGGIGKDVLVGGRGKDSISSGLGDDVIIDQKKDVSMLETLQGTKVHDMAEDSKAGAVGTSVSVVGDDNFKMRVESDLVALQAMPSGRKILEEIDKTGHTVTITQADDSWKNGSAGVSRSEWDKACVQPDGSKSQGTNVHISYNPSFSLSNYGETAPPALVLGHELCHAYNMTSGTMLGDYFGSSVDSKGRSYMEDAAELQAVGLPISGLSTETTQLTGEKTYNPAGFNSVAHPDGTTTPSNPEGISENALRADLNIGARTSYR